MPKEMKWYIHINICKRMLIAALSVITNWKPPKYCQLVNKLWYIPTVEFYSAIKTTDKNKSAKRMNLLKRLCWTKEASTKDKIQYNSNIQLWNIYQTLTGKTKLQWQQSSDSQELKRGVHFTTEAWRDIIKWWVTWVYYCQNSEY